MAAVEAIASPLRKAIGAAISGQLAGEQFLVGEAKQLLKSLRLLGCIKRSENVESIEALLREDPTILTAQRTSFSVFLLGSLSRRERKGSPHLWLLNGGQSGFYFKHIAAFCDVPYGAALSGARTNLAISWKKVTNSWRGGSAHRATMSEHSAER